jgi:hypothetical protein
MHNTLHVACFKLHGLKILQADDLSSATKLATSRNGGAPADWITRIDADDYDEFRRLAKLGWRGSMADFHAAMRRAYSESFI